MIAGRAGFQWFFTEFLNGFELVFAVVASIFVDRHD